MSRLRNTHGKAGSLRALRNRLKKLGLKYVQKQEIARKSAASLNPIMQRDYDAGRTVYGAVRPLGVSGPLDLINTRIMRDTFEFVAQGAVLRVRLTATYAKFLIGKYQVLPIGDRTAMPRRWQTMIDTIVDRVMHNEGGPL